MDAAGGPVEHQTRALTRGKNLLPWHENTGRMQPGCGERGSFSLALRQGTLYVLTVEEAAECLKTAPRFIRPLVAERRIVFPHVGCHVRIAVPDLGSLRRGEPAGRPSHEQRRRFGCIRRLPSGRWHASDVAHSERRRAAPSTFKTKGDGRLFRGQLRRHAGRGETMGASGG